MKTDRAIDRYNRTLRTELGEHPLYAWKWSEDLIHVMDEVDSYGKPVYEECVSPMGIIGLQQRKKPRKFFDALIDQWVVCALIELGNDDGQVHGTGVSAWIPVTDRRGKPAALPQDTHPNQDYTEKFIAQLREFRVNEAKSLNQWQEYFGDKTVPLDETERNSEIVTRNDAAVFAEMKYKIKQEFTAFGEEPGKRGGTSFPKPLVVA